MEYVRSCNTEPVWELSFAVTPALFLAKPEELLIHPEKPTYTKALGSIVYFTEDLKMETEWGGCVTAYPVFLLRSSHQEHLLHLPTPHPQTDSSTPDNSLTSSLNFIQLKLCSSITSSERHFLTTIPKPLLSFPVPRTCFAFPTCHHIACPAPLGCWCLVCFLHRHALRHQESAWHVVATC